MYDLMIENDLRMIFSIILPFGIFGASQASSRVVRLQWGPLKVKLKIKRVLLYNFVIFMVNK